MNITINITKIKNKSLIEENLSWQIQCKDEIEPLHWNVL